MGKPKAIVFGAGAKGRTLLPSIQKRYEVVALIDNDESKWTGGAPCDSIPGLPVCAPDSIKSIAYDAIVIGTYTGLEPMTEQLLRLGVEPSKIDKSYIAAAIESRIAFLEQVGELFRENDITGCVAEGGVFQGEFAKEINRVFPNSTLYLFDTFTGFDARDVSVESRNGYSQSKEGHFNITSEEMVLGKLPHPEKCVFLKGHFPETAEGLEETFCFVNLDFDLYMPILAGLDYFVPRMVPGGIILIDDYFAEGYTGVKDAVREYQAKSGALFLFPIGDFNSIGVLV